MVAGVGVGAVLWAVVGARVSAQLPEPQLGPAEPVVRESGGTVVITISKTAPGRVVYRTVDGTCSVPHSFSCPPAISPEDYRSVSGEVIFTTPGSHKVTIPIVDDDVHEIHDELFAFEAYEADDSAGWPTGRWAYVRIVDDDPEPPEWSSQAATATTTASPRSSSGTVPRPSVRGSDSGGTAPTTNPGVASAPAPAVALASAELRPGPGFELTGGAPPKAAPPSGGDGGSFRSVLGSGVLAGLGGAGAFIWRRRRWSPTRV